MAELEPTIFVIDDDPSVRKSLTRLLRASGYVVEEYPSAEAYLRRAPYPGTGCIILDFKLEGKSGIDLQRELNDMGHDIPIVFLTGFGDVPTSVRALKNGAGDFLLKPVDEAKLLEAVRQALDVHRKRYDEREKTRLLRSSFDTLTPREFEVMRWVLTGKLNKQIAGELGIAEKTVKVHRGQVMRKLGVDSVAELVRLAEAAGIALAENLNGEFLQRMKRRSSISPPISPD
jgi:FixJ family two-component response regulator